MQSVYIILCLQAVYGFSIDSKLDLPDPTVELKTGQQFPILDSSLSPKIIKAFYEINFLPTSSKPENTNTGYLSLSPSSKNCPYTRQFCKYLYFVPTKVSTVQEIEDLIKESKENGEIPIVKGTNNVVNIDELMKEVNRTISEQVNKKVPTTSEVPVYKGVVNTDQVLNAPEISEYPARPAGYQPNRQYYPTHSRPRHQWADGQPRRCLVSPCHWSTYTNF
ncbi:uncharacterized protein [Rhodnius prolixus]|uniref:uncharacterized protein n=1 Tax=Rhodnius prolixus TaxID=13249 RepID=UPI003D18CA1F